MPLDRYKPSKAVLALGLISFSIVSVNGRCCGTSWITKEFGRNSVVIRFRQYLVFIEDDTDKLEVFAVQYQGRF